MIEIKTNDRIWESEAKINKWEAFYCFKKFMEIKIPMNQKYFNLAIPVNEMPRQSDIPIRIDIKILKFKASRIPVPLPGMGYRIMDIIDVQDEIDQFMFQTQMHDWRKNN